jgi:hypothetical protein
MIRKTFRDVKKDPPKNVFDPTRDGKKTSWVPNMLMLSR